MTQNVYSDNDQKEAADNCKTKKSLKAKKERFSVRATALPASPGTWNSYLVEIYDWDLKVGEYVRNYSLAESTFYPFEQNGQWYALYSRDYTSTRLMSLPDCKDLGGEERDSWGFCPVEFFVPRYKKSTFKSWTEMKTGQKVEHYVRTTEFFIWDNKKYIDEDEDQDQDQDQDHKEEQDKNQTKRPIDLKSEDVWDFENNCPKLHQIFDQQLSDWNYCPFGFVAGCVWGDDSSWKIQFIDLSNLINLFEQTDDLSKQKKSIVRDDRFGYLELPSTMNLSQAINMRDWTPSNNQIQISHEEYFDLDKNLQNKT